MQHMCKICNKVEIHHSYFWRHLKNNHNITSKEYYNTYIKCNKNFKPKCPECNKNLEFLSLGQGYKKFCSSHCKGKTQARERPEINSRAGKIAQKNNPGLYSKIIKRTLMRDPELNSRAGKIGRKKANRTISKFKRITGFGSIAEMQFFSYFAPIYKDKLEHENRIYYNDKSKGRSAKNLLYDFKIDNLIIEIDGSYHNSLAVKERDKFKDKKYKELGYQVLRIKNEEVLDNIKEIYLTIRQRV